jgi:cyclophilin family peptidyl-prolyl cis-trans isomerase
MRFPKIVAIAVVVVVCGLFLAAVAVAGGENDTKPAEGAEKKVDAPKEKIVAKKMEEAKESVTTTLTVIKDGKKQTKEIKYLPSGKKTATLETTKGTVKIELWEDKAPNTVANFIHIAMGGKYDGVEFHRVIDGFMAQTGDVEHKSGTGGPGWAIPAEFDSELKHVRGVVSMARAPDPDSGGSQFFIMLGSATHLDGQYAAFGKVIEGMDVIDKIKKGPKEKNGAVPDPDKIIKVTVESVPYEKPEKKPETPEKN